MTSAGGSRDDFERLFLENLRTIDRMIRTISRRHALSPEDRAQLTGRVHKKIIEHDYRVLRAFEGRSNLSSFLAVVISRELGSYCIDKRRL